jgi:hypothetical protein
MSAMVLRTGSKTRKLTDAELISLAAWLWDHHSIVIDWLAFREADEAAMVAPESDLDPDPTADIERFLLLPEGEKAIWITLAESNYLTVCLLLGDHIRPVREPAEGGGQA